MKKIIFFTISILMVVVLISCSKTPQKPTSSTGSVTGTYNGFLTGTNYKTSSVADVSQLNDSMVSIHCYDSAGFDTIFMMELFQNGEDSLMLCSTGEDFYNQYGHYMYSMMGSMMGGSANMNGWQQFMNAQQDPGQGQYGSFDMMNGSFYFPFTTDSAGTIIVMMTFNGSKN